MATIKKTNVFQLWMNLLKQILSHFNNFESLKLLTYDFWGIRFSVFTNSSDFAFSSKLVLVSRLNVGLLIFWAVEMSYTGNTYQ